MCNSDSCGTNEACDASGQCLCAYAECNGVCCGIHEECAAGQCQVVSGKIAFVSNQSGFYEVWVVNEDGTGLRQVTSAATDPRYNWGAYSPRWSPDGSMIAFYYGSRTNDPSDPSSSRIMVVNEDGTGLREVRDHVGIPATQISWTTDGAELIVTTYDSCDDNMEAVDVATGSVRALFGTSTNGYACTKGPDLNPSGGQEIAYQAYNCGGNWGGLRLMDLSSNVESEITPAGDCMGNPRFSGDGTFVAGGRECANDKSFQMVASTGGAITTISPVPQPATAIRPQVDWTATGFVYSSGPELWVCDLDGSGAQVIVSSGSDSQSPDWAPGRLPTCGWVPLESDSSATLLRVWGSSASDVYVIAMPTEIRHFDGNLWSTVSYPGSTPELFDVWGSGLDNVWVTGSSHIGHTASIIHFDGQTWTHEESPGDNRHLGGVWGASATEVFAVGGSGFPGGTDGVMVHYDGSSWSSIASGFDQQTDVWGTSADNVVAVGELGWSVRWNGSTWDALNTGTSDWLLGVWLASTGEAFAAGQNGTLLTLVGSDWQPMDSGVGVHLRAVSGRSASDVYAVGHTGTILHYDGSSWTPQESGTTKDLMHIWVSPTEDLAFIVGIDGTMLVKDCRGWNP